MTHTYALLEVSPLAYEEIKQKLIDAGYDHVIDNDGDIDLHGLGLKRIDGTAEDSAEKILEAAAGLKEAITDAKAKLLLSLEAALQVGYHMRQAQKAYSASTTERRRLFIESKRLEAAFDRKLAEMKTMGVDFNE